MRTYVVRRAPTTSAVPALKPTFCSWLLAQQAVDVIVVQELHHWGCIRRRITLGLKASGWILSGLIPPISANSNTGPSSSSIAGCRAPTATQTLVNGRTCRTWCSGFREHLSRMISRGNNSFRNTKLDFLLMRKHRAAQARAGVDLVPWRLARAGHLVLESGFFSVQLTHQLHACI